MPRARWRRATVAWNDNLGCCSSADRPGAHVARAGDGTRARDLVGRLSKRPLPSPSWAGAFARLSPRPLQSHPAARKTSAAPQAVRNPGRDMGPADTPASRVHFPFAFGRFERVLLCVKLQALRQRYKVRVAKLGRSCKLALISVSPLSRSRPWHGGRWQARRDGQCTPCSSMVGRGR
jgi:hypothetical protein